MPLDLTDDKSTLVQVMAWCHQAASHYLSQCWPRAMAPNGVTRPQWVNSSPLGQNGRHSACNIFRCIFVNEKFCISIRIALEFVLKGLIYKKNSIGLDNGLAPNRQVIIWTNADPIHWHIYAALGGRWVNPLWLSNAIWFHRSCSLPVFKLEHKHLLVLVFKVMGS